MGASARGLSRRREDARTLLTAHAALPTPAGEDAAPPAEGGLTPRPRPPRRGHRRSHGLGCPGAAWPGGAQLRSRVCGGQDVAMVVSVLCRSPRVGTPNSRPRVLSRGFARSLDRLKVHRAINTRAQRCQRLLAGGAAQAKWDSLQLTLWVRDSPRCGWRKRNPPIRNGSKARGVQQTPSVGWFLLGTAQGLVPGAQEHSGAGDVADDACFVAKNRHSPCVTPRLGRVLASGTRCCGASVAHVPP